ncbi:MULTISPECIES: nuclear transport factor 2 family protein [Sphingobacterium]|uniref:nuclear transport factor 2 family protein n=1 Tax=Sphingobacterium TaxID=28453 RepID=UPI0010486FB1|nr:MULTISPECIES: nuclear transport factor 2 family protein [Sphingobacterium]MCW2260168.1 putative SnoaL-like aldol condensation-catalyzing enzyme [Sphingobacterium kitahiroshimense]TCR11041.1 putative SnoaL-like aldol condensation-catalyzing enzyme [Sphingobacterium sp. JUb78]
MELSNRDKAEAIQNSIETETLAEIGLISPTSYTQHNPNVATGLKAILGLHDQMPMDKVYTNVVRKFQDGDYGFVHVDYFLFEPTVAFDIHRFENGVSVEHWDNLQSNPKKLNKSGRTMTDGKTKAKDHHKTEVNKALVKDFVQNVLINGQLDLVSNYFKEDELIQHNPYMADGVQEFLNMLNQWQEDGKPQIYKKIHKVLGEGNFVLVLSEGTFKGEHVAFYDLYRIEDGKIVEHWDVVEAIPETGKRKNSNGKF